MKGQIHKISTGGRLLGEVTGGRLLREVTGGRLLREVSNLLVRMGESFTWSWEFESQMVVTGRASYLNSLPC